MSEQQLPEKLSLPVFRAAVHPMQRGEDPAGGEERGPVCSTSSCPRRMEDSRKPQLAYNDLSLLCVIVTSIPQTELRSREHSWSGRTAKHNSTRLLGTPGPNLLFPAQRPLPPSNTRLGKRSTQQKPPLSI